MLGILLGRRNSKKCLLIHHAGLVLTVDSSVGLPNIIACSLETGS